MSALASKLEALPLNQKRAMALGVLPLVTFAVAAAIVWPIAVAIQSQSQWREEAIATLARTRGSKEYADSLSKELTALPASPLWGKFYNVAKAGGGGALLQADVSSMLSSLRINVQSMTPLRSIEIKGLHTVGLRVSASMTVDQLKSFLSKVSSAPRYLRVDRMRVNAPPSQLPDQNALLTVTLELSGVERALEAESRPPKPSVSSPLEREVS